jgi:hypothetical protein
LSTTSSSRKFVASAYASIFAKTPITQLKDRVIGLREFTATGSEIAQALEHKHGMPTQIFRQSLEQIDEQLDRRVAAGDFTALAFAYRRPWGTGRQFQLIGNDIWEVEGYQKTTLEEVILGDKLEPYKEFPAPFLAALEATFF